MILKTGDIVLTTTIGFMVEENRRREIQLWVLVGQTTDSFVLRDGRMDMMFWASPVSMSENEYNPEKPIIRIDSILVPIKLSGIMLKVGTSSTFANIDNYYDNVKNLYGNKYIENDHPTNDMKPLENITQIHQFVDLVIEQFEKDGTMIPDAWQLLMRDFNALLADDLIGLFKEKPGLKNAFFKTGMEYATFMKRMKQISLAFNAVPKE